MDVLDQLILSDEQWVRISTHIIGDEQTRGTSGRNNRMLLEAVLRIVCAGSPWSDLSDVFGAWEQRLPPLQPLERQGRLAPDLQGDVGRSDSEYLILDSTIVRAHQHVAGAKEGLRIRRSDTLAAGLVRTSTS